MKYSLTQTQQINPEILEEGDTIIILEGEVEITLTITYIDLANEVIKAHSSTEDYTLDFSMLN